MQKRMILIVAAMILSAYAGDSFLNSCQKKWNASLMSMKSFRADMVQTMMLKEYNISNSQNVKIMYLKLKQTYLRMDVEMNNVKSFVVCRGDSMFVKTSEGKWKYNQQNCAANPLTGTIETLLKSKLKFVKENSGVRVYRDSLKMEYKIQTKTCRVLDAENSDMLSSWEYENINDIDVPIKNIMSMKNNSATIEVEFKNPLVNQGVTKSFFEVK